MDSLYTHKTHKIATHPIIMSQFHSNAKLSSIMYLNCSYLLFRNISNSRITAKHGTP